MSTKVPPIIETLQGRYAALTSRERKLLLLMVVMAVVMTLALGNILVGNNLRDTREGNVERREALDLLLEQREAYLQEQQRVERMDERLEDNTLRLSSFIENTAQRADVPRPTEFRDHQQPVSGRPGVTAMETTVTFPSMSFQQLTELLNTIDDADELVFIQTLKVQPARRGEVGLDAELTLVTYRQSQEN